jgi:hypothetical protein
MEMVGFRALAAVTTKAYDEINFLFHCSCLHDFV